MYPKYIFIVPYRERELEKLHYSIYIEYILEDYDKSEYEIYFSEQLDLRPFNRGATKNIGFLAIKNKYPENYKDIIFIFNDVDTLPFYKNQFDFYTEQGCVKHFFGFNYALGGLFSIKGSDFEKINGFPNLWGWGLEDNEIQKRVLNYNIEINRENFIPYTDKNILNLHSGYNKIMSKNEITNFFKKKLDNINNITDLDYTIVNNIINSKVQYPNQYIIKINKFNTLYSYLENKFYNKDINISNIIKSTTSNNYKNPLLKINFNY